ncbi:PRC-barrel domain-containing protein [Oleisolibacter albus]|uniref:PRC-barrel domain-containing protein n=1 Tax=Oleisolibacter albus TaxID=2171757 RepID=UPI000DF33E66|nr:PRC-barrel domain-containing protein [Oleisolibacter albus]
MHRRRSLPLAGLCLVLAVSAASAQQPPTPVPVPSDPAATDAPLTTGTRPEDVPTTSPQTVNPGLDGDAPADDRPGPAASGAGVPATGGPDREDSRTGSMAPPPGATTMRGVPQSRSPATALTPDRARALIGRPVLGSDGKDAGTVRDFVTGPNGLTAAVLDRGTQLVLLPLERLHLQEAQRAGEAPTLHAAMTAAEIGAQPDFRYGDGLGTLSGAQR